MRHRLAVLTTVLALAGVAACGHDKKDTPAAAGTTPLPGASVSLNGATPGASPGVPSASASAQPGEAAPTGTGPGKFGTTATPRSGTTPSAATHGTDHGLPVATEMSAAGVGPYAIGAAQAQLSSAGLIGKVSTDTNGCGISSGVKKYRSPGLVFVKGRLEHVKVTSSKVRTTAGVQVGTPFATAKSRYPGGRQLADWNGAPAWYATDGDHALLLRIKGNKVSAIEAGTASTLSFTFTDNQGC
jgi:hypothetical protein